MRSLQHVLQEFTSPRAVALWAWTCFMLFAGSRLGAELMATNSTYVCAYGADCHNNSIDSHCCKEPVTSLDEMDTPLYVCRPACVD